jgi:hypothetical protein
VLSDLCSPAGSLGRHWQWLLSWSQTKERGFGISLKDVTEGSFFRENFGNIRDVFRGPINLEACRLEPIIGSLKAKQAEGRG